jgi:ABC-type multidrug transport system fused ATPase/permease subunit
VDASKEKARPARQVIGRLWGFMGRYRRMYVIGLALGILDALCQTLIPMVFRTVLNALQADPGGFMRQWFWPGLGAGLLLVAVFLPTAFLFHTFCSISVTRLVRDMRNGLYQHIQRLSADFFHRRKVGELNQRLSSDIDNMANAAMWGMGLIWQSCMITWATIMMLSIEPRLTALFAALMLAVAVWSRYYMPRLRVLSRNVRDAGGEVSAIVTEYVSLNDLIKSYTSEDVMDARVHHYTNQLRKKSERFVWQQYIFSDLLQTVTRFLAPFALLFVGAALLAGGRLRVGDLVAFWGFWLLMGGAVNALLQTITSIFTGLASADRVLEIFDENPLVRDAADAVTLPAVRGDIAFENVSFNYPAEKDQPVLRQVSFVVPAGRRVAIVGPSGAGKSTLLQLIMRFYDPLEGRITLDGQDLRRLAQANLRGFVGMVMQDSAFFSGSIEDNLRLAKEDATAQELEAALAGANALEFIQAMPRGLKTVLGERGVRLSGGQKQRLSIARVFLKNPPILLLDEATSSLDSLAERQVQQAMDRLMTGRTTLIVAHRISTIQNADEIIVLHHGRLVARGRHVELLSTCPLYRSLCAHQHLSVAAGSPEMPTRWAQSPDDPTPA